MTMPKHMTAEEREAWLARQRVLKRASILRCPRRPCTLEEKAINNERETIRYHAERQRIRKYQAEYIRTPEARAKKNERFKHRYDNDLHFHLASRLRNRVRFALTMSGVRKRHKTANLVGCSIVDLKAHLEKQFTTGMSWDRLAEIHIDHKRPISNFDLTDPIQLRTCFHFSNLQPLWGPDNLRKSDKYTP